MLIEFCPECGTYKEFEIVENDDGELFLVCPDCFLTKKIPNDKGEKNG